MNQEPKVKEPRRYLEHEMLAEIFGFVPTEVTDDIYNLANIVLYRLMEGIANRLVELHPDKQRGITSAIDNYETKVEKTIDELFNVFQQYVSQQVWKIPRNMNIDHEYHEGLDFTVTQSNIDEIDKQVKKTRENIIAQKKFKAIALQMERNRLAEIKELDQHLKKLSFLTDVPKEENVQYVDELLKIIKKQIDQAKEGVIRQLASQEELNRLKMEEDYATETRLKIDNNIKQLHQRSE